MALGWMKMAPIGMATPGANGQTLGAGNRQVQEQSEHQGTVEPAIAYRDPAKETALEETNYTTETITNAISQQNQ